MRNDARTTKQHGIPGWETLPEHLTEPRPETLPTATVRERQIHILQVLFDTVAEAPNDD